MQSILDVLSSASVSREAMHDRPPNFSLAISLRTLHNAQNSNFLTSGPHVGPLVPPHCCSSKPFRPLCCLSAKSGTLSIGR